MQTIQTYDFNGKKALIRVDFNVPLDEHFVITDDTRIDVILAGCLLGCAVAWGWVGPAFGRALRVPSLVGLVVLGGAALLTEIGDVHLYRDHGLVAVLLAGTAIVGSVVLDPDWPVNRVFGWRPLALLGDRSYSLYLWHVPVFLTIARHAGSWPVAAKLGVGLVVAFALTEVSYRACLLYTSPSPRDRTRHRMPPSA